MTEAITLPRVAQTLSRRLPIYGWRAPVYQTVMLRALQRLWDPAHRSLLDVGGGTGIIAQTVHELFPVERVMSIDVEDRYLSDLTIDTQIYDGANIPFDKSSFDAVMFNNVLHHVPPTVRVPLLQACRQAAGAGPIYIKDHLAGSRLDHIRLKVLDWIGNTPFKGMVRADYLERSDWAALARASGYRIAETLDSEIYRRGPWALAFPNRLEISMKWLPLDS